MKLTYRGTSYEYTPPEVSFESSEIVGTGKYRGLDWRFRNPKKAMVMPATLELRYRGAAYRPGEVAQAPAAEPAAAPAAAPAPALATAVDRSRALMMKQQRQIKNRQQALLSRSANEVGLSESISNYWNRIQGKVHPTFRAMYGRSAASLS